jgi:hypothetical protein
MNTMQSLIGGATALSFLSCLPLFAGATLDADFLEIYGGSYMIDCADPASAKATVFDTALVFLDGNTRIAGSNADAAFSYFGNSPPENFLMALLSDLPDAGQMIWMVYQDDSGMYLTIDGDGDTMETIGTSYAGQKFYRCDGAPPRAEVLEAPQRNYELHELSASGILMYPGARAAYYKALGPLIEEAWLAELDGPSSENSYVVVDGAEYLRAFCCKNHDCYENNVVFLYSPRQNLVYGKVYQGGKSTLIGAPPPEVAKDLERLWQELFRSNPQ